MSIPSAWPLFTTRGPLDVLLDTSCFSTSDFGTFNDFVFENHPLSSMSNPTKPIDMQTHALVMEVLRMKALSDGVLDNQARYSHPSFPPATFLTTLLQQKRFKQYISNEFPSLNLDLPVSTVNHEPLRKELNATVANSILNAAQVGTSEWVCKAIFPNEFLPVPFDDACLDNVQECWDKATQQFSNFPKSMGERDLQDWLNHLAHTLGVQHSLIKEPKDLSSAHDGEVVGADDGEDVGADDGEDVGVDEVDGGVEKRGFVIAGVQDRSFSMIAHQKGPSGGYRLRKPDIMLINRNLRHFLKDGKRRPRWHHVEAIVEVSASAPRASMLQQIIEKAALMFETQPYRRFAIGLALRGTGGRAEFCFVLVDRAGACLTNWAPIAGYEAINFARIVFGLSYANPEFLGIDTSMTVDFFSGDVTKIKVEDQEFKVIKHIHSSLILLGRGTHVFLVQDKEQKFHILKDAWLLSDHGISEITILSSISNTLKNDPGADAQKYRSMHPRFVVGEEIGDSTNARRGRLTKMPPERLHRRAVTGPVGDSLTSFRSREEFVKVLLDCVDCKSSIQYQSYLFNYFSGLEYLHKKCNMVHGDLSINNIVIYRTPPPRPPSNPLRKGAKELPAQTTRASSAMAQAAFIPAPKEGLAESIPVTGVVIDYDYARKVGTAMEKTSVRLAIPWVALS